MPLSSKSAQHASGVSPCAMTTSKLTFSEKNRLSSKHYKIHSRSTPAINSAASNSVVQSSCSFSQIRLNPTLTSQSVNPSNWAPPWAPSDFIPVFNVFYSSSLFFSSEKSTPFPVARVFFLFSFISLFCESRLCAKLVAV